MLRCDVGYIIPYASKDCFASIFRMNGSKIILLGLFESAADGRAFFKIVDKHLALGTA
jgi:hypothetical protein